MAAQPGNVYKNYQFVRRVGDKLYYRSDDYRVPQDWDFSIHISHLEKYKAYGLPEPTDQETAVSGYVRLP